MTTAGDHDLAIETSGLTKRFGSQTAVNQIDLAVPRGSVFGFLGPNGSGKTTSIRMMLGLVAPSSGEVRVLGREVPRHLPEVLPRVGALVEGPGFYPFLSGSANLRRLDSADRGAPSATRRARVESALDRVGLSHAAGKKVGAYSLGMKQRLGIANALLVPRELLVLDEPTNGLDPQGTREVRHLIRTLTEGGTTVFVSSHLLTEIEQMCTHAAMMSVGGLVAQGTLDELRRVGEARIRLLTPDGAGAMRVLARLGLESRAAPDPDAGYTVTATLAPSSRADAADGAPAAAPDDVPGGLPAPEVIVAALVAEGVRVRGFSVQRASLEERFVALTGEGFDIAQ